MKHQEKKYKVDSFEEILKLLNAGGAEKQEETTTTHYYAELQNNNVVKLVSTPDKNEIHIWTEKDGIFSMTDNIPVESVEAGFKWLAGNDYKRVGKVKMVSTDYKYERGLVGLYTINDWLLSVILDFPSDEHEKYEKEFGLKNAEVIKLPYNKYLNQLGKLKMITTAIRN